MAVSVDTVYQRVLALANKEQRGYITPQEFNLIANQAQLQIFEGYFNDINQFLRNPGNNSATADSLDYVEDKISIFQEVDVPLNVLDGAKVLLPINNLVGYPGTVKDIYKLEEVRHNNNACAQVTQQKLNYMRKGVFAGQPTLEHPLYIRTNNALLIYHLNAAGGFVPLINNITCDYVRKPINSHWDYVVVNGKALYNANGSTDFELHPSEESALVYKILELSGVVINKPGLSSYAKTEHVETENKRKI